MIQNHYMLFSLFKNPAFSMNSYLFFLLEPLVVHKWVSCCPAAQLDNLTREHCLRVWLYNDLYTFKTEFTHRKVMKKYKSII